jgi:hypothetical protein
MKPVLDLLSSDREEIAKFLMDFAVPGKLEMRRL